jgi:3',5'-cyclic AMP phosphodiesterase CpdA
MKRSDQREHRMSLRKPPSGAKERPRSLTIVLISDTHELHRAVEVPPGDLLIHAGDFTMDSMSAEKLLDFNDWLGELPHAFRVVIPGNHDFVMEGPSLRHLVTNATVLINESVKHHGVDNLGIADNSAPG